MPERERFGILPVDKPQGFSSHDVVQIARRALKQKRIGHAGTLDPMAEGLLILLLGPATRASDYVMDGRKEYVAELLLGLETDTQDIWGKVTGGALSQGRIGLPALACIEGLDSFDAPPLNDQGAPQSGHRPDQETLQPERPAPGLSSLPLLEKDALLAVIPRFLGEIDQVPPMYSAIKLNGQKLYELARRGDTVKRAARPVVIESLSLLAFDGRIARLRVSCSKGTYIRTLCHDIGRALGCGACMSRLTRTRSGELTLQSACSFDALQQGAVDAALLPVDVPFLFLPKIDLNDEGYARAQNGAPLYRRHIEGAASEVLGEGLFRVYFEERFLMICTGGQNEQGLPELHVKTNFMIRDQADV